MRQTSFIDVAPAVGLPFQDIRNTRPSTAEEKARLVLQLGKLMRLVPARVANGSIQTTRDWMRDQKAAAVIAKNSRASINDLSMAIKSLQRWTT